ncbi:MAG: AI-2E family transporter [Candidatus Competibacter sp.]|nr:AI-2E family transporter [Candidatus Competibacteraceae bacterium]
MLEKSQFDKSHAKFWLILGGIVLGALYLLAPVLSPFLVSALLAYLGDPLIDWLETHKISRSWAVTLVFGVLLLIVALLLLVLIPLSAHQFKSLIQHLPGYVEWFQASIVPWLREHLAIDPEIFELSYLKTQMNAYAEEIGNLATRLLLSFQSSSAVAFNWLANLILVPVVTFYLLRDWDLLVAKVHSLLPRRIEPVVRRLARESNEVIGAFLRGQFIIMGVLAVLYSAGLSIIGLDFSLLIGLISGLVSFVPYLGPIIGIAAASIVAIMQTQSFLTVLPILVIFGIGQLVSDFLLMPRLVGDRIGLHPVTVMFAVLAGGQLFGFFGVLLALPAAAVIAVVLRHAQDEYLHSIFYQK